jgi:cytochrome c biogenesis protein CcmG/thiol:disulfide interchange protein DsbE
MKRSMRCLLAAALLCAVGTAHAADTLKDCALDKLDGSGKLDLSKQPGKLVYVDFWASWCGPCKQSFPFMNKLKKQFEAKGVTVVAISVDKDPRDAVEFLKDHPADFTVVSDPASKCAKAAAVKGMPTSYIVGKDGTILYTHKGFRPADMEEITKQLQLMSEKQ